MAGIVSVGIDETDLLQQLKMLQGFDAVATEEFKGAMQHAVNIAKQVEIEDMVSLAQQNQATMRGQIGSTFTPLAPVNPRSPASNLSTTVVVNGPADVIGVVGPHTGLGQAYIKLTQEGRPAGKAPPVGPLQGWAERVLGVVPGPDKVTKRGKNKGKVRHDRSAGNALAKAIRAQGIRPSPSLEKSLERMKARVETVFAETLPRIASKLGFK